MNRLHLSFILASLGYDHPGLRVVIADERPPAPDPCELGTQRGEVTESRRERKAKLKAENIRKSIACNLKP